MRSAVAALPTRQREAVLLRYFCDLPLAEIADVMSCRPGTIKALLYQAMASLRSAGLSNDGDEPDETEEGS